MELSVTLVIILVTVGVSLVAFNDNNIRNKLIFYPPAVSERNEWWRFFTSGFIHADIPHLIFNMYALYLFGAGEAKYKWGVEYDFIRLFGENGRILYLGMYLLALIVCLLPTYKKNKHNYNYLGLGASGAVSAVIFAKIILDPLSGIGLVFIPVYIAGFIFGIIYLVVSSLLDKRGKGNINHSAHIWGGLFGIVFLLIASKLFSTEPVLEDFISRIQNMRADQFIYFR